ncbi:Uncharacterised protein [Vibrio cholerae]|nr:Uncharacterised protein [Vibrio cholerae]
MRRDARNIGVHHLKQRSFEGERIALGTALQAGFLSRQQIALADDTQQLFIRIHNRHVADIQRLHKMFRIVERVSPQ